MSRMAFIKLNHNNIDSEHLCCAISERKCKSGTEAKREMIRSKLNRGYIFNKLDVKGKVFADYCPINISLLPVHADGYMAINCFWVSGQHTHKGYARALMEQCFEDCQTSNGIIVVSSDKKRPFLSDKQFFRRFGFTVCDTAPPYFELLVYKNRPDAADPRFFQSVKLGTPAIQQGIMIYYSNQCPYTEYHTNISFKQIAEEYGVAFQSQRLVSRKDIQHLPTAQNIYSVFLDGKFITHEIMSVKKIHHLLAHHKKLFKDISIF
jgi:ribosomal protein S18 acetylase RimI-like enzyme